MSKYTNKIITATTKIINMCDNDRLKLLLTILGSNPTVVMTALAVAVNTKYKIVLVSKGADKINLIKAFREIVGAGLADAKNWSEGSAFNNLPFGVLAVDMDQHTAWEKIKEVNIILRRNNVPEAAIVEMDAVVPATPFVRY